MHLANLLTTLCSTLVPNEFGLMLANCLINFAAAEGTWPKMSLKLIRNKIDCAQLATYGIQSSRVAAVEAMTNALGTAPKSRQMLFCLPSSSPALPMANVALHLL